MSDFPSSEHLTRSDWDPLTSYLFTLRVELMYDLPLKSVHVFQRENEFEYIQEGGLNDYVHMRRKPISKPFTFQVERYVDADNGFTAAMSDMFDPLANGTELVLPVLLSVYRRPSSGQHNTVSMAGSWIGTRTYFFTGCVVTAKEFGELNAERPGLLVETTTIAYKLMGCLDLPWMDRASKQWMFATNDSNQITDFKGVNANGNILKNKKNDWSVSSAKELTDDELKSLGEDEKNANILYRMDKRRWQMSIPEGDKNWNNEKGGFKGKNNSARVQEDAKEKRLSDMKAAAEGALWSMDIKDTDKSWNNKKAGFKGKNNRSNLTNVDRSLRVGHSEDNSSETAYYKSEKHRWRMNISGGEKDWNNTKGNFKGTDKQMFATRQSDDRELRLSEMTRKAESKRWRLTASNGQHGWWNNTRAKYKGENNQATYQPDEKEIRLDAATRTAKNKAWKLTAKNGKTGWNNTLGGYKGKDNHAALQPPSKEKRLSTMTGDAEKHRFELDITPEDGGWNNTKGGYKGRKNQAVYQDETRELRLDAATSAADEKRWEMDISSGDKNWNNTKGGYKGKKNQAVLNPEEKELRLAKMKAAAKLWKLTAVNGKTGWNNTMAGYKGEGNQAVYNPDAKELRLTNMTGKAKVWKLTIPKGSWNNTKGDYKGQNNQAKYNPEDSEKRLEAMTKAAEAKLWDMGIPKGSWDNTKEGFQGKNQNVPVAESETRLADATSKAEKKHWKIGKNARDYKGQGGSATHQPGDGKRAPSRVWPGTSSAVHRSGGSNPPARLWPKTVSATHQPNDREKPEQRIWPPTRSARTVAEFLNKK